MSVIHALGKKLPAGLLSCCYSGTRCLRNFSATTMLSDKQDCQILIVGGGTGGCALAAKLSRKLGKDKVTVLEPQEKHYYQPMFTLIGGGMKHLGQSYRMESDVLPKGINWIKEKAVEFDPKSNTVTTSGGKDIKYDILLIATGLQLNYEQIPGLVEALSIPNGKVCSIYSPKYVNRTYDALRSIQHGDAIFTYPASPVKCPGAPQKIMYIAEHLFRKSNRNSINVIYNTALPVLFGVKHYADALWKIVEQRNIEVNLQRNLVEVRPESNTAIFVNLNDPSDIFEKKYSLLHAVPPMGPPTEIAACKELAAATGFVDVNKDTLQHVKYTNVFAIGDCSSSPNSKTAASAAAQAPVVFRNILATLKGEPLKDFYDGYASCPLVTGYNSCILAEFDYSLKPLETFPVAQNKERYSMFLMKKEFMPPLYWLLMMNGWWNGPALLRNMLSIFKFKKQL